ncbi:terpenoid synthase [Trametopsis cervina]|nr:terpenoid synthase [Trametopsis cervina]
MSSTFDTTESARSAITRFLHSNAISMHPIPTASTSSTTSIVETILRAKILPIPDSPLLSLEKHLQTGLAIGTLAYAHTRADIQAHIATHSMLVTIIDDRKIAHAALEEFIPRLLSGAAQLDPLLDMLVDNLRGMSDYYAPASAGGIVASTLEFVNAMLRETDVRDTEISEGAMRYARYVRAQNGMGEAYCLFVWDKFNFSDVASYVPAIADAAIFVCFANDILSFYKEELLGDYQNMVHSRAAASGKDVVSALNDIVDETTVVISHVRDILKGREKDAWEQFMSGYSLFHYLDARYRLHEVLSL